MSAFNKYTEIVYLIKKSAELADEYFNINSIFSGTLEVKNHIIVYNISNFYKQENKNLVSILYSLISYN